MWIARWQPSCHAQPRLLFHIFTVNEKRRLLFTIYCRYTYSSRPTTLSTTVCLWLCLIHYHQCVSSSVQWVHLGSVSLACIVCMCTFVMCMHEIWTLCVTMLCVCTSVFMYIMHANSLRVSCHCMYVCLRRAFLFFLSSDSVQFKSLPPWNSLYNWFSDLVPVLFYAGCYPNQGFVR